MSSAGKTKRRPLHWRCSTWLGILLALVAVVRTNGEDLQEAQAKLISGDYTGCVAVAEQALQSRAGDEEWSLVLCRALLNIGKYPEARVVITNALQAHRQDIRLYWQAREAFLANGQVNNARQMLENIGRTVWRHPSDFSDANELVVSGQTALLLGADPKRVLDRVFDPALKLDPKLRDVYLASGNLAIEKHDFSLAAKRFQAGLAQIPDDPDLLFGLAQAYAPNNAALMLSSLESALEHNTNHVKSLLLLTDYSIDAEDYAQAAKFLVRIEAVNPWVPDAWAYRAVLAHLQGQKEPESTARENALKFWPNNPRVDYLIGLKLSQNYRFEEGAGHQRQALSYDPEYLPAKAQLAHDLLRLGQEAEGWQLAEQVQKQDAYDVEAYNLATLHDSMAKFTTLTNQDFVVRMDAHEAAVFGVSVLDLLNEARKNLSARYGFEPSRPTTVEIFHEQKDFAVRTFGMPGNPGYLGVCFGNVITANSPAAQFQHPVNWQAVLWHEFCHVITLQLTRNKMPRWLSEGISVYEEEQANPTWGQRMNPQYREMVLGGDLTPISDLSAAFLAPPTPVHLQFAYYEASLVVEFLVQRFGLAPLKEILKDLGEGVEINQAIERHTVPMQQLEKDFTTFANERAEKLAPGLDFAKPGLAPQLANADGPESTKTNSPARTWLLSTNSPPDRHPGEIPLRGETLNAWITSHPTNYYALSEQARSLVGEKQFQAAKAPLEKLVGLYPEETGPDSGPSMLAAVYHELGETNSEWQLLQQIVRQDDEALQDFQHLMEIAAAMKDWPAVLQTTRRYLAVDPLRPLPYQYLAQAAEKMDETQAGIAAYRALLQLDPPDPAETHFKLGQLLFRAGDSGACRQVLEALEEAPRYRAALDLLLQIDRGSPQARADLAPSVEVHK